MSSFKMYLLGSQLMTLLSILIISCWHKCWLFKDKRLKMKDLLKIRKVLLSMWICPSEWDPKNECDITNLII